MDLHQTARRYRDLGFSVIPIMPDGSKSPAVDTWKDYMRRLPTDDELHLWFASGELVGIAIICGAVSGGLEVIDFDDILAYQAWLDDPNIRDKADWRALPRVKTPSGGMHIYIRRNGIGSSRKLAKDEKGRTLIEVKAEGGYVLAPGCPPECHPMASEYKWEVPLPTGEA